jgi:hypothetical protein
MEKAGAENSVNQLRYKLGHIGQVLVELGNALQRHPEKVILSNAPQELGSIPTHLACQENTLSFLWEAIPDKESLARLTGDLRTEIAGLEAIRRQLGLYVPPRRGELSPSEREARRVANSGPAEARKPHKKQARGAPVH